MSESLVDLQTALSRSQAEIRDAHKNYLNPGLVTLMGLLDFSKRYVRAEGVSVWDEDGNRYLDFLGGYGSLNLGHNPPVVLDAIRAIQERPAILHTYLSPLSGALGENLGRLAPGDLRRTFFSNSGTEAVEAALKLARAATGRKRFLSCDGSFHGKSLGSLSISGRKKYQTAFLPLVPGCTLVPYGDAAALERELAAGDVAGFIVEPVQGEGGIIVPPPGYLKRAEELCRRFGALFIVDEVQTGLGRTGALFACEHDGVTPDVMCLAKSLGGGVMPVGATITTPEIWDRAFGGIEKCTLHTSTMGGNAWAMAAGIATLNQLVDERLSERARTLGEYFLGRLQELKGRYRLLSDIRGRGLMIGLEFTKPQGWMDKITGGTVHKLSEEYLGAMVAGELLNRHRIITAYTFNNPNVIRLEPPLTVTCEEIDVVVSALEEVFSRNKGMLQMAMSASKTVVGGLFKRG